MKVICYACMCIFNTINSTVTYITCMPISHPLIHTFNAQHLESKASLFLEYYVDNDLTINFLRFLYLNNLNSILIKAEHQRFFPATERYYCYMLEPFLDPIVFVVSFWWKHLFSTKTKQGKTMVCGTVCTSTGQREITAARSGMEPAGVVVIWCLWWIVFSRRLITAPCNRVCLYTSLLLCQCFPFYIVQW